MRIPSNYPELPFSQRLAFIDLRLSERGIVRSGGSPGRWTKEIDKIDEELCAEAQTNAADRHPTD